MQNLPYELNRLYNEDSLAALKKFPDKSIDVIIADPPYGIGGVYTYEGSRLPAVGGYMDAVTIGGCTLDMNQRGKIKIDVVHGQAASKNNSFGDDNVSPSPEFFKEIFRASKNQIIFGGNYYTLPPTRGVCAWVKPTAVSEKFSMAAFELIWTSFNQNARIFSHPPMGRKGTISERIHPTQKPVPLYDWLLDTFCKAGDLIVDTHVGSASSLISCKNKGFDFIGFELSTDYYHLALERMAKYAPVPAVPAVPTIPDLNDPNSDYGMENLIKRTNAMQYIAADIVDRVDRGIL